MANLHDQTATCYRVQVASELDEHWGERLDGWRVLPVAGTTILERNKVDQAALYGLLIQLRDLGLVLLAVERTCRLLSSCTTFCTAADSSVKQDSMV